MTYTLNIEETPIIYNLLIEEQIINYSLSVDDEENEFEILITNNSCCNFPENEETDPFFNQWLSTNPLSNFYPLNSNPAGYLTQKSVLQFTNLEDIETANPIGNTNTIYVANNTDTTGIPVYYIWNGEEYVEDAQAGTGINGIGIPNKLVKWILPNTIGSSGFSEPVGLGARYEFGSQFIEFLKGGTAFNLGRSQSNLLFILGVQNAFPTQIYSSQEIDGVDYQSQGDFAISAGGPLLSPTTRVFINRLTGNVYIGNGRINATEKLHINGGIRLVGALKDRLNLAGTSDQILKSTVTGVEWVNITSLINDRFKGKYTSLTLLQAAYPTANDGDYAIVDAGIGVTAIEYLWDANEGWVSGSSVGASTTDALPEGSSNLYFTQNRVRETLLSGLSLVTFTPISALDNIITAFGKLQAQLNNIRIPIAIGGASTHTGTVAEIIVGTPLLIPANFLDANCNIWAISNYQKSSAQPFVHRKYINTSPTISGATLIALYNSGSNRNADFTRKFLLRGTSLDLLTDTTSRVTNINNDSIFTNSTIVTINPGVNLYIIDTVVLDNSSSVITIKSSIIEKQKL